MASYLDEVLPRLSDDQLNSLSSLSDDELNSLREQPAEGVRRVLGLPTPTNQQAPLRQLGAQAFRPPASLDDVMAGLSTEEKTKALSIGGDDYLTGLIARHSAYADDFNSGHRPDFVQGEPSDDDLRYAQWLRDTGRLSSGEGPGFWRSLGSMVTTLGAGTVELGIEAFRYRKAALIGTDQEQADAVNRDVALGAEAVNQIQGLYRTLGAGARRLGSKVVGKTIGALAQLQNDPAWAARVSASDEKNWYKLHQSLSAIQADQQRVHQEAADIAIHAGWSESGLDSASTAGSFVSDPGQFVTDGALRGAGRLVGAVAPKAALGVADGLRAEVVAGAKKVATLEQTAARLALLKSDDAVATHEVVAAELATANREQAAKVAALKALDEQNSAILAKTGRPSLPVRATVGLATAAASATEQLGHLLGELNAGVVDHILNETDASAKVAASKVVKRIVPTALAGGIVGGLSDEGDWKSGAIAGAAAPAALANFGRLTRIMGENFLIGRASTPYMARLSTDAEARGLERWIARSLDVFSPAVDFARTIGSATARGAAVGGAFGYVAAGGENSDLASAAGAGAAGHFAPWAMLSTLKGTWSGVRSPGELEAVRAANLRLLRDRWQGSENLARLDALPPSTQLDIAHLVAANPDFTLRLVGKDDAILAADQLSREETPKDFSNVPGFRYSDPATGRSVIVLNPAHPDAAGPVLAHEFFHKAQSEGMAQSVVNELIGDSALGVPGMFTKLDAEGAPVRRADGSFETTSDFTEAKATYEKRLNAAGVTTTLTDAEFALEHAAEQGADYMLSPRFQEALRPTVGGLMASLFPQALRDAAGALGVTFDPRDQSVRGTMGLGLRRSPAVERLSEEYLKKWRVGRNAKTVDDVAPDIEVTRDQVAKNPDVLKLFSGSSALNVDAVTGMIAGTKVGEDGKLVIVDPKKVFKAAGQIAKEQAELAQVVVDAVKAAGDVAGDKDAVKVTNEGGREVASGRYLSDETLKAVEGSGRFNPIQLQNLRNLSALTRAGTGDYVRFFYQPALRAGSYASLRGQWRTEVPYGFHISKEDNIIFRTVSYDKVAKNLQKLWAKETERATNLWSSPMSMLADARVYLNNLSQGLPGETGLSVAKRDFINLGLGISTKGRADVNPLYDADTVKKLNSFVVSRRIDRTNRLTAPEHSDKLKWSYEAYTRGKLNLTAGAEPTKGETASDVDTLGFHSQLERTLAATPENAMRGQIDAALRDGVKVKGQLVERPVRKEEMDDIRDQTGQSFAEFLAANPTASRQELLDFAQANRVRVAETVLGENSELPAIFKKHAFPGGKNYREAILTFPGGEGYVSPHFPDIPDYVAHTRWDERTDADGQKVLFCEEAQSDNHQQGRRAGYLERGAIPGPEEYAEAERAFAAAESKALDFVRSMTAATPEATAELGRLRDEMRAAADRINKMKDQASGRGAVPDAPFKKSWPDLLVKYLVRKAAQIGADKLAWTTGAQQAARYGNPSGGEGMQVFYDRILPDAAEKIGKKYGVAPTTASIRLGGKTESVHALPISAQMRSDILERGLPLFTAGRDPVSQESGKQPDQAADSAGPAMSVRPVDGPKDRDHASARDAGPEATPTLEGAGGKTGQAGPGVPGIPASEGGDESRNLSGPGAGGRFRASLADAAAKHPAGAAVDVKSAEDYDSDGTKLFMAPDGSAGAAVSPDGTLHGVFRAPGSKTPIDSILREAAQHATKLDCFASGNGYLVNLYGRFGFRPVARVAFDPEMAPKNWPEKLGKPDVVFMVKDLEGKTGAPEVRGNWVKIADQIPVVRYSEAIKIQSMIADAAH